MSIKSQYGNKVWPQWIIAGWKREIKLVIQIMQHTGAVRCSGKAANDRNALKCGFFFFYEQLLLEIV